MKRGGLHNSGYVSHRRGIARGDDPGRSRATTNRANYALPLATRIHARSKIFVPEATENLQRLGITELKQESPRHSLSAFLPFFCPKFILRFGACNFERNIALNFHLLILHLLLSFSQSKSCIVDYFDKEEEILNWILVWTLVRMKEYGMERNAILCVLG